MRREKKGRKMREIKEKREGAIEKRREKKGKVHVSRSCLQSFFSLCSNFLFFSLSLPFSIPRMCRGRKLRDKYSFRERGRKESEREKERKKRDSESDPKWWKGIYSGILKFMNRRKPAKCGKKVLPLFPSLSPWAIFVSLTFSLTVSHLLFSLSRWVKFYFLIFLYSRNVQRKESMNEQPFCFSSDPNFWSQKKLVYRDRR